MCGSDGVWYKNLCSLRYHRCAYNIITLQRDREQISCKFAEPSFQKKMQISLGMGVLKPDFSAVPPLPLQDCSKSVQCLKVEDGLQCWCVTPNKSETYDSRKTINYTDPQSL